MHFGNWFCGANDIWKWLPLVHAYFVFCRYCQIETKHPKQTRDFFLLQIRGDCWTWSFNVHDYEKLSNFLLSHDYERGKIDKTLFIKKKIFAIILVQIYVDDNIFGTTNDSFADQEWSRALKNPNPMCLMKGWCCCSVWVGSG